MEHFNKANQIFMKEVIQQDKKLGRGLSALLGDSKSKTVDIATGRSVGEEKISNVELISLEKITAGLYQPRQNFNQEELDELAFSIKENGLIQPIILRKSDGDDHYEIVAGERRFRAAKIAGFAKIPAIIKKINNHEALEMAIVENVQRSDLSLIEEAKSYKQLMEEFSYSQEHVAKKTGKSRSHIANILRLLTLPKSVRELIEQKTISMGHARAIINSSHPEDLARKIVESSLTVRGAEDLARDEKIEKMRNTPVLVMTESKIKFINSGHLVELENQLTQILDTKVKISYNQFKNTGKVTIDFSELSMIEFLIKKLGAE